MVRKETLQIKKTREKRKLEKWSDVVSKLNLDLTNGVNLVHSNEIKEITNEEPRLMAKIDQVEDLPSVFKKNGIFILPVDRHTYALLQGKGYHALEPMDFSPEKHFTENPFPTSAEGVHSESVYLDYAYATGLLGRFSGVKNLFSAFRGRRTTPEFDFSVGRNNLTVDGAQIEIDGSYENVEQIVLVEAKLGTPTTFIVRQLYYPYRLWSSKLSKKVIPILMTFSQDVFDFFIYEFATETEYNSITLVKQKRYAIAPEEITTGDVAGLLSQINVVPEPQGIPFPQANRFDRVVDLLSLHAVKPLTKDEITENYEFDARQTNYYTDAGRYLGLIDKSTDSVTREVTFSLTDEARLILSKKPKQKHLELIRKILEHNVYQSVFQLALQQGKIPEKDEISQIIVDSQININSTTAQRRASTVHSWIQWIWKQIE